MVKSRPQSQDIAGLAYSLAKLRQECTRRDLPFKTHEFEATECACSRAGSYLDVLDAGLGEVAAGGTHEGLQRQQEIVSLSPAKEPATFQAPGLLSNLTERGPESRPPRYINRTLTRDQWTSIACRVQFCHQGSCTLLSSTITNSPMRHQPFFTGSMKRSTAPLPTNFERLLRMSPDSSRMSSDFPRTSIDS